MSNNVKPKKMKATIACIHMRRLASAFWRAVKAR